MSTSTQAHGIPDKAIRRYRKVKSKLAPDSGCGEEERKVAVVVLRKLAAKHPGIEVLANIPDITFSDLDDPDYDTPFDSGRSRWKPPFGSVWSGIFGAAQDVIDTVARRKAVADLAHIASQVHVVQQEGQVVVTVILPMSALDQAASISEEGRVEYVESTAAKFVTSLLNVIDV